MKKTIGILVAVVILLGMIPKPTNVFAAENQTGTSQEKISSGNAEPSNQVKLDESSLSSLFPDQALAYLISKKMKIELDAPLLPTDLDKIKQLKSLGTFPGDKDQLAGQKIVSLAGMEIFENLTELDLPSQGIENLIPLSTLKTLRILTLDGNLISDITPLTNLNQLDTLWLDSNKLERIDSLKTLTNLKALRLQNNQIVDIKALEQLPIEQLVLRNNQINDFSPVNEGALNPAFSNTLDGLEQKIRKDEIRLSQQVIIPKPFINIQGQGMDDVQFSKLMNSDGIEIVDPVVLQSAKEAIIYDINKNELIIKNNSTLPESGVFVLSFYSNNNNSYSTGGELFIPFKKDVLTYPVNFNSNGGSFVESQQVETGLLINKPVDPTKAGAIFSGWYSDQALTQIYNFSTPVTNEKTLYAKWIPNIVDSYEIRFESNGGTQVEQQVVKSGQKVKKPMDPTRLKYTFIGWFTDQEMTIEYDFSTPVKQNQILYGKWKIMDSEVVTDPIKKDPETTSKLKNSHTTNKKQRYLPQTSEKSQYSSIFIGGVLLLGTMVWLMSRLKKESNMK